MFDRDLILDKLNSFVILSSIVADNANGKYASWVVFTEGIYFEPAPNLLPRVAVNRYERQARIDRGIRTMVIYPPITSTINDFG